MITDYVNPILIAKRLWGLIPSLLTLPQRKEAAKLANDGQRIQNARNMLRLRYEAALVNSILEKIESQGVVALTDESTQKIVRLIENQRDIEGTTDKVTG